VRGFGKQHRMSQGGHSGRNETFLCIFEKNIFLDILEDSKNISENRIFDQTSS
jgi:hypothetical protein